MPRNPQIICFGLSTGEIGGLLVDGQTWVNGIEASNRLRLVSKDRRKGVPYATASFIADVLAFEHEMPTLAVPAKASVPEASVPWTAVPRREEDLVALYLDDLERAFEVAADVNHSIWLTPVFRHDLPFEQWTRVGRYDAIESGFTGRFGQTEGMVHLYNTALRQADPLSRYLMFYRVIERGAGNNGKIWIQTTISGRMNCRNPVWAVESDAGQIQPRLVRRSRAQKLRPAAYGGRYVDVTEVMRAAAREQLTVLRRRLTDAEIARRLYNENRCGIAHGAADIRRHDLAADFHEVLGDLRLVHYLARLAIDEKL